MGHLPSEAIDYVGWDLRNGPDSTSNSGESRALKRPMEQRLILHIVGGDSRSRAEQARVVFDMGHHAEVYSELEELLERPPREGVLVACGDILADGISSLLDTLGEAGIWMPVIAASHDPHVDDVVSAIRGGALDYISLPLDRAELKRVTAHVLSDAGRHAEARRRLVEARARIGTLSRREREVLDWLSDGHSNKSIARELDISPRTVEIHRANMMEKLGAQHAADAVRLKLEASFEEFRGERAEAASG